MEWSIVGMNFLYAILGLALMYGAFRVIDRLIPEIDFAAELNKGNVAVAIFIGAMFIGLSLIIAEALN
jgi:uncharacterized membrane protein YjfL (UPF0719 family)